MYEIENFEKFFNAMGIPYSKEESDTASDDAKSILGTIELVTTTYIFVFDKHGCFVTLKERV